MPSTLALLLCTIGVVGLLVVERRRNPRASYALWVPTVWMLIAGSRPIGRWFVLDSVGRVDYEAGSLPDRVVLTVLTALAVVLVAASSKVQWSRVLKENAGIILLFAFMGLSVLWVDSPFVSLKRWIRSAGAIGMALVILTEARPLDALASVLRRCAYVLVPFSFVLIRYLPVYGRAYGRWDGLEMWTGVATHKNSLGQMCALSAVFLVWDLFRRRRSPDSPLTTIQACADLSVLAVTIFLLYGPGTHTFSATSISISVVGVATFFVLSRSEGLARLLVGNLKIALVLMCTAYLLLADTVTAMVSTLLNRDKNLTGRATDIWPVVLAAAARHPILGAGYGGVWGLGGEVSAAVGVEQAHNGYLDVYLQLGIVGAVLLLLLFLNMCGQIQRQFKKELDWGIFGVSFLVMTLIYNLSETAFFDVYLGTAMILMPVAFSAGSVSPAFVDASASLSPARTIAARTGPVTVRRWAPLRPSPNQNIPTR